MCSDVSKALFKTPKHNICRQVALSKAKFVVPNLHLFPVCYGTTGTKKLFTTGLKSQFNTI